MLGKVRHWARMIWWTVVSLVVLGVTVALGMLGMLAVVSVM